MRNRDYLFFAVLVALVHTSSYGAPSHTDTPDVRITDGLEVESSVFVSPLNPDVVLVSNNRLTGNPPSSDGVSAWISTDGGMTWVDQGSPLPNSHGDPACVISRAASPYGRFVANYIGAPVREQIASFKDDPGPAMEWSDRDVFVDPFLQTDKNHLWVDNSLASLNHQGNLYCAWTGNQTGPLGAEVGILVTYSTDSGESWEGPPFEILHSDDRRANLGVNIQTGKTGTVYAAWSSLRSVTPGSDEIGIGFSLSPDGGVSWSGGAIIKDDVNGLATSPIRPPAVSGITMLGNSYPSMTVDQSTGDIYIVWANRGVPEAGLMPVDFQGRETDIYIIKSSDDGVSWGELGACPKRVNNPGAAGDDCGGSGACGSMCGGDEDQWFPWITWDEATGAIVVVYLSSEGHPAAAETNVAISHDGGFNWQELKISDELGSGDFGGGYDYIGISAGDGIAYPVWSDDRQGVNPRRHRAYTSPILLWGPDEDTIVASFTQNAQGDHDITVTWDANVDDADEEDTLILTPPSGPDVTITQLNPSPGFNHSLSTTEPCQLGDWTYVVKSTRNGRTATSTVGTFTTPSAIVTAEVQTYPQSNHFVVCPAGEAAPLVVTVNFDNHCSTTIASTRNELDELPVNQPNPAFFPPGALTPADEDADAGNSFTTTITKSQIGGCDVASVPVFLDGRVIGSADFTVKSPDLNGDGFVNATDLGIFPLGSCEGDSWYIACANFVPSPCVDASDLATIAAHIGHDHLNPLSKVGGTVAELTTLDFDFTKVSDNRVSVSVKLDQADQLSTLGLVLRPNAQKIQFVGWSPSTGFNAVTEASVVSDPEGSRIGIVALAYWRASM